MTPVQKVDIILTRLYQIWPEPKTELVWSTPLELLMATILSAQTTDKVVNMVTPALFAKYLSAEDYARALVEEIDLFIYRVNFHRTKATRLHGVGVTLVQRFHGQVPQTQAELITIPGVARKTANVVLGEAFHQRQGIVVDTHVIRLSRAFGLTSNTDPVKIEQDLLKIVPREHWTAFSRLLILYGRYYCPARHNPKDCLILKDLVN